MNSVSSIALGVSLALGGLAAAGAPAHAQAGAAAPAMPTLSKPEREALAAFQTALQQRNYPAAASAGETARSAARSGHARYLVAAMQLRLGLETSDSATQAAAIEAMIESGAAPPAALGELYKNQGILALGARRHDRAEVALTRWVEAQPNSPEALVALAEVKDDIKKVPEAVNLLDRAIKLRKAAGQPVPESWYKRGLKHAIDGQMAAPSIEFSRALVTDYPSPENWRDALLTYRDFAQPDPAARLDLLRLMRSANALGGERDYLELAQSFDTGGVPGESKAVLDEGVKAKMVDPAKATYKEMIAASGKRAAAERKTLASSRTKAMAAATGTLALSAGDMHFSYGEYAAAAELYRAALTKGSVDASVANTRLGMALALAGQRAEAEAALRAVTGPRTHLASYWLLWLAQRG
jgi:tetratricopeptide (TPR) repeat protein